MTPGFLKQMAEVAERRVREETIRAVVDWLRGQASGYALLKTVRGTAASSALYAAADKIEKDWQGIVH